MHGHDNLSKRKVEKRFNFPSSRWQNMHTHAHYCNHKPHMVWHKVSRSDIFQYFWHPIFGCLASFRTKCTIWISAQMRTTTCGWRLHQSQSYPFVRWLRCFNIHGKTKKPICHTIHSLIYSFHHFVAVNIKLNHVFHSHALECYFFSFVHFKMKRCSTTPILDVHIAMPCIVLAISFVGLA